MKSGQVKVDMRVMRIVESLLTDIHHDMYSYEIFGNKLTLAEWDTLANASAIFELLRKAIQESMSFEEPASTQEIKDSIAAAKRLREERKRFHQNKGKRTNRDLKELMADLKIEYHHDRTY